jgi:hypothetical protein
MKGKTIEEAGHQIDNKSKMKKYTSSLDIVARVVPWFLLFLAVMITIPLVLNFSAMGTGAIPFALFGPVLIVVLYISMYLLKTLSIRVDEYAITIDRKVKPVIIPFSEISSIRKVDDMRFAIRTFGNGGVFGYTGYFYKKGIGSMVWYCTQRTNYILIETNGKKIVITPDDADGFLKDIAAANPSIVAAPTTP